MTSREPCGGTASYEEQAGRIVRRLRRASRAICWPVKGALGLRRDMLVEIRWRLGDEVMALPVYGGIKAKYPGCRLTVWCHYPDLLIDHPHVDAVNEPCEPDRYVLLRGASRTEWRLEAYAKRAGIPTPNERPTLYFRSWDTPILGELPEPASKRVAICTGATWATKRWPHEHWVRLVRIMTEAGYGVIHLGQGEATVPGTATELTGRTTVYEAACVLQACRLLISCDTGLMHLARAAGVPVLALFGPTAPEILLREDPGLTVMRSDRPCVGCWNAPENKRGRVVMGKEGICPLGEACCLEGIMPEQIAEHALSLMEA